MKKEGIRLVILGILLLISISTVQAGIQVPLVDYTTDYLRPTFVNTELFTPGTIPSVAIQGVPAASLITSPTLCADNSPATDKLSGLLLSFNINRPANFPAGASFIDGGVIEIAGGKEVKCFLNNAPIGGGLLINDLSGNNGNACDSKERTTIASTAFVSGVNLLSCEVSGNKVGFTLSRFVIEMNADVSEIACKQVNPSRTAPWEQELFDQGVACCGDDPADNGLVVNHATGSYLCSKSELNEFAWHRANVDSVGQVGAFSIQAINKNDIISNKEKWITCNDQTLGPLTVPSLDTFTRRRASKFTCMKKDDRYIFLECCDPTQRGNGDRVCQNDLLTFPDRTATPGAANTLIVSEDLSATFEGNGDFLRLRTDSPDNSHKLAISDWKNYNKLGIVFKNSVNYDTRIIISYINDAGQSQVIFSDYLREYIQNTPHLDAWMYAEIPVASVPNIDQVLFQFAPLGDQSIRWDNQFTVGRLFLIPKGNTPVLNYCTNSVYVQGQLDNLWRPNLDDTTRGLGPTQNTQGDPAGKSMCNGMRAFSWTGTQCCGNNANEFFNDIDGACWNGKNITHLSPTITDTFYTENVPPSKTSATVTFPEETFSWDVEATENFDDSFQTHLLILGAATAACKAYYPTFDNRCVAEASLPAPLDSIEAFTIKCPLSICAQGGPFQTFYTAQDNSNNILYWVFDSEENSCGWKKGGIYRKRSTSTCGTFAGEFIFPTKTIVDQDQTLTRIRGDLDITISWQIPSSFTHTSFVTYKVTSSTSNVKLTFLSTGTDITTIPRDPIIAHSTNIIVNVNTASTLTTIDRKYSCSEASCLYPHAGSDIIVPIAAYNIKTTPPFVNVTTPQQILLNESKFNGCFAAPNPPGVLVQTANTCSTKNNFLCSILDLGWTQLTVQQSQFESKPIQPRVNILKNPRFDES